MIFFIYKYNRLKSTAAANLAIFLFAGFINPFYLNGYKAPLLPLSLILNLLFFADLYYLAHHQEKALNWL